MHGKGRNLWLVSVPSSGSRKNGNSAASSEERIPLKPEEVKWKRTRTKASLKKEEKQAEREYLYGYNTETPGQI
jgi:hypothetical protein